MTDKKYKVYILEVPNGKKYVGMTCRKPEYRWNYGKKYKSNERFYEDIKTFGWENVKKTIVASNLAKDEAGALEKALIKSLETQNVLKGYNIEEGGKPEHLSESTRRKISEAHKGQYRDEIYRAHISESKRGEKNGMFGKVGGLNPYATKVRSIDRNGNIREFDSISLAVAALNLSKNSFKNISACCKGKRPTAYGFKWSYV